MKNKQEIQEETSSPINSDVDHHGSASRQSNASCAVKCVLFLLVSVIFILIVLSYGEEFTLSGLANTSFEVDLVGSKGYEYEDTDNQPTSLLYIVTSSAEFNNVRRGNMKHHSKDRLMDLVVPVIKTSIMSMQNAGFKVDLYMIVSYNMTDERRAAILQHLPEEVSLEVWSDAVPIDYDVGGRKSDTLHKVQAIPRGLARQHRFVVKDKLWDYDML